MFFFLFLFIRAISSTSIRRFNIDQLIIGELLEYGPVAEINYLVQNKVQDPLSMKIFEGIQEDLGLKVWIQINKNRNDPSKYLLTAVRLDNIDEHHSILMKRRKTVNIDFYWKEYRGWPSDLVVTVGNQKIDIPSNPDNDSLQISLEGYNDDTFMIDNDKRKSIIPNIIHQITSNSPGNVMKVVEKTVILVKVKNQHWDHRQYSLDEMGPFIEKEEGRRVRRAFDTIIPKAYKADILRLVLLKKFGGIYLDSQLVPLLPFKEILPINGNYIIKDLQGFINGFMAFRIGDPFLKRYLDQIVMNIENRYYGETPLSITGPMLLKEIFDSWEDKDSFTITTELDNREHYFFDFINKKRICIFHNTQYRSNQSIQPKMKYRTMWLNFEVYDEERAL